MKKKVLGIAKSKVRHFDKRIYCGWLTPSEFLALVDEGIQPRREDDVAFAKKWKEKGRSDPSWFYFQLGKVTLEQ